MYLRFHSSPTLYTFYRVPMEVYGGLLAAPSKGHYYQTYIKGRYSIP
jgi:hypothetical protein